MKTSVNLNWKKKMAFEATIGEHKLIIDASEEVGGENQGPRPKPLILVALAGCTGIDVVSILKKMRVEVDDFKVNVEATLNDELPKDIQSVHVIYQFAGKDLPMDKLEKAVSLSDEKYCGVTATLRKGITVTHEIVVTEP